MCGELHDASRPRAGHSLLGVRGAFSLLVAEHLVILVLDGSEQWFEGILVDAYNVNRRQVCREKVRVSEQSGA